MSNDYQVETIIGWGNASVSQPIWNELHEKSSIDHPFASFEWFTYWYHGFCPQERVRLIVVKCDKEIRAIFPGLLTPQRIAGICFRSFSYAGNGHSPRCTILGEDDNIGAIKTAIITPFMRMDEKAHLIYLMNIEDGSSTERVLKGLKIPSIFLHVEHSFASPAFDISRGWTAYFMSRSRKFRQRLRLGINRARRHGEIDFEVVLPTDNVEKVLTRLESIDRKTWQHKNGTGLFSVPENRNFYTRLIKEGTRSGSILVAFLKIGGQDAAYELGMTAKTKAYLLKYGFNPKFGDCSPGVLVQSYLSEYLASLEFKEIDLVGETTAEKSSWATHFRKHKNYWLINKRTIKGRLLVFLLTVYGQVNRYKLLQRIQSIAN